MFHENALRKLGLLPYSFPDSRVLGDIICLTGIPAEAHQSEESHQAAAGSTLGEGFFANTRLYIVNFLSLVCPFY